jgi:Fe-S cluster biogenesis protein NfuA
MSRASSDLGLGRIGRAVAGRVKSGIKRRARRVLGRIPGLGGESSTPVEPNPAWSSKPAAPLHAVEPEPEPTPTVSPFARAAPAEEAQPVEAEAPEAATDVVGPPLTVEQVEELFEDMVRPALRSDGGDIDLLKVEDNDVYVRLMGACSSCPSSTVTMKMGVERLLAEEFPQFRNLIQVA